MVSGRSLHYVLRVANRKESITFFRDLLGMKVLRHEEFSEGCAASCNGNFDNRWSKTMIGYGPEDNHFVVELTYNYPVSTYQFGNSFLGMTIKSSEAIQRIKNAKYPVLEKDGKHIVRAPVGYPIILIDEPQPTDKDPVQKISLSVKDIQRSIAYWNGLLQMKLLKRENKTAELTYDGNQTILELQESGVDIDHGTAGGRLAFAIPFSDQPKIANIIEKANEKVLTPLISLDTPGKATVRVIILADPDGHEICFVEEEGFSQLSAVDPEANNLVDRYIKLDKSRE